MTVPRARLAGYDWVVLMASLVLGGVAGYLGLLLGCAYCWSRALSAKQPCG